MSAVFQQSKAKLASRLVLLAIADCAGDESGSAWPSIGTISRKSGLSESQTHRAITNLVAIGELKVDRRAGVDGGNLSNLFTVLVGGVNLLPGGVAHDTRGVSPMTPKSSLEPSTIKKPSLSPLPSELDHEDFKSAWNDYIAYRKEARMKPLIARTVSARFKTFTEWGRPTAITAIRNAICNGWIGIPFPNGSHQPEKKPLNRHARNSSGTLINPII